MLVAIVFGSRSDTAVMKKAAEVLRRFEIPYTAHILSAHRVPELLKETLNNLEEQGAELIIAGAGLAAHLPGVIASLSALPVIGVPLSSGALNGIDALLSVVQMPKPIPVATVGVDNAANAAYLACQILALKYPELDRKLRAFRISMKSEYAADSAQGAEL